MIRSMSSTTLLAALTATVLALSSAGCSSQESGTPSASDATTTTSLPSTSSSTRTSKSSSSAAAPTSPLVGIDPCGLLEPERAELGLAPGEASGRGSAKTCDWTKSGDWGVVLDLVFEIGVKDGNYEGGTPTPIEIGRHEATKLENVGGGGGGCDIYIAVTDSSTAHISATASGLSDTPKACAKALQVAQIIDPKLP